MKISKLLLVVGFMASGALVVGNHERAGHSKNPLTIAEAQANAYGFKPAQILPEFANAPEIIAVVNAMNAAQAFGGKDFQLEAKRLSRPGTSKKMLCTLARNSYRANAEGVTLWTNEGNAPMRNAALAQANYFANIFNRYDCGSRLTLLQ